MDAAGTNYPPSHGPTLALVLGRHPRAMAGEGSTVIVTATVIVLANVTASTATVGVHTAVEDHLLETRTALALAPAPGHQFAVETAYPPEGGPPATNVGVLDIVAAPDLAATLCVPVGRARGRSPARVRAPCHTRHPRGTLGAGPAPVHQAGPGEVKVGMISGTVDLVRHLLASRTVCSCSSTPCFRVSMLCNAIFQLQKSNNKQP